MPKSWRLASLGPDWDPLAVLREEDAAHALLYLGLNEEQQRLHAMRA
ncbi:DUF6400 family protein [Streptomyces sp. NPDC056374]